MILRPFVAVGAALLLTACQTLPPPVDASLPAAERLVPRPLSSSERNRVQEGVRRNLKDPSSAEFGAMIAGDDAKGITTVCGWVNARNSFGGFTGMQPYIGILAEAAFVPVGLGGRDTQQEATMLICSRHGLAL